LHCFTWVAQVPIKAVQSRSRGLGAGRREAVTEAHGGAPGPAGERVAAPLPACPEWTVQVTSCADN